MQLPSTHLRSSRTIFSFMLVLLLLLQLLDLLHAQQQEAANFATKRDGEAQGATALQPEPSEIFQHLDTKYPFLIPLPGDRANRTVAKW